MSPEKKVVFSYLYIDSLKHKAVVLANHPYQGMFHVPNPARNGERPRDGTN